MRKLCGSPSVFRAHVAPPSPLRCTPSLGPVSVATYTTFELPGSNEIAAIGACWSPNSRPPWSTRFQVAPPSRLRQTPSLWVPAKTVWGRAGSIATAGTVWPRISGAIETHVAPRSVERKIPPP